MFLWSDLGVQSAVVNWDEPAFLRPIRASRAEVRFRASLRAARHDANRLDPGVAEREDHVARRHFPHVLVELVTGSVRVLLR